MTKFTTMAALAILLCPVLTQSAPAGTDGPRELAWSALVPPIAPAPSLKSRSFLSGAQPPGPDGALPPQTPEAGWMSSRSQQPDSSAPPAVVPELDGQRVRIGGYVVALDFDATSIREFLLVPFVGACIHVPPPPANQIIYVKSDKGFEMTGTFDPVSVVGTMKTETAFTGLADAGYRIEAESVDLIKQ